MTPDAPRYIFTHLSPLAKVIFNPKDEDLLNFLVDDNQRIEPSWSVIVLALDWSALAFSCLFCFEPVIWRCFADKILFFIFALSDRVCP